VVGRLEGKVAMTVRGPETRATSQGDCPSDGERLGILLKMGTFLPHLPTRTLVDTGVNLPTASRNSFWLSGSVWQFPDYDNADADTLFLGEVTYKIMATYWPTADTNPEAFQGDAEGAHTMNSIRKVVFSKNLKDLAWSNSALKTEIVPEEIKKMKQEPGKNMLVAGSASIVQQLTNFGLVDEYHLLVHPVILGNGKPLFKDIRERHNLKLISTEVFKNGVVLLRYEPEK